MSWENEALQVSPNYVNCLVLSYGSLLSMVLRTSDQLLSACNHNSISIWSINSKLVRYVACHKRMKPCRFCSISSTIQWVMALWCQCVWLLWKLASFGTNLLTTKNPVHVLQGISIHQICLFMPRLNIFDFIVANKLLSI